MTREDAKANQDRIARHYNLSWWYGTECRKCCGVYPKIVIRNVDNPKDVHLECEVCGRKTKEYAMPWIAKEEWNEHFEELKVPMQQISLFDFM